MSVLRFAFGGPGQALAGARALWMLLTEGSLLSNEATMLEDHRHAGWLNGPRRSGVYLTFTPAALQTWNERRVLGQNGCIINVGATDHGELDPEIVEHLIKNAPVGTIFTRQL